MTISLRLRDDFRLVHEPIRDTDAPKIPEEAEVSLKLRERLANSTGGAFLITGFRGVGKTTAVYQAMRQLEASSQQRVIGVTVPVARPIPTTALLFEVIRKLVERLEEMGITDELSGKVRETLSTAYRRTSFAYRQTSTWSAERARTTGIRGNGGGVAVIPEVSSKRSRAESEATELASLTYGEADAEHDFLRLVDLLGRSDALGRNRAAQWLSRAGIGAAGKPLDACIVIVFDEIDKFTQAQEGGDFEEMLTSLKNLLAAFGVHFVVVGGVDLHDRWLLESSSADSLYRSVFAWQGYVGCAWRAGEQMTAEAVADGSPTDRRILADYLEYRGRGVIRNILYEFNDLVDWSGSTPVIELEGAAEERVRLLADLSQVLRSALSDTSNELLAAPSDGDRLRQAAYFTVDWVLRAGTDPFGIEDVIEGQTPLDPVLKPKEELVRTVLTALVAEGYLEVDERDSAVATEGPDAERDPAQYALSQDLRERLTQIVLSSPRARAEFGREEDPNSEGGEARKSLQRLLGDAYKVQARLGQGGFGIVWTGIDDRRRPVAIKVIRTHTPEARRRAKEEVELLKRAQAVSGVIRLREVKPDDDRTVIVTELVDGPRLDEMKPLPPAEAVRIACELLQTAEELHRREIVHADIKPSNVMIDPDGDPILIDLGTARRISSGPVARRRAARDSDLPPGTRAYMAPELFMGAEPGPESDVWAVAILLLEVMSGKPPSPRTSEALEATVTGLDVSSDLKRILREALSEDPRQRPRAASLRVKLETTPEWKQGIA